MEPTTRYNHLLNHIHHLFRLPLHFLLSLLPSRLPSNRLFSLVALKDLSYSLLFLRSNLRPTIIHLDPTTSLHLWVPRHRHPKRPALVLIHGFGGNAKWQFKDQIGPLSRSFDLYVPDLVFFGRSESDSGERSVGFQARCVGEAMRRIGVGRYSVAGISYGGYVAYLMAEMEGEGTVDRVVIMSSGICATVEQRREMVEREGRDVCEILVPERAEDLMTLMRRSMYRPPKWVPGFLLRDFIQVGELTAA